MMRDYQVNLTVYATVTIHVTAGSEANALRTAKRFYAAANYDPKHDVDLGDPIEHDIELIDPPEPLR